MVFFYEKDAVEMQVEARLDPTTRVYTITRRLPDGTTEYEQVVGEEPCRRHLERIAVRLETAGWRRSGPPKLLL